MEKSHRYFRILKSAMYPNGKKRFTRRVLDMLSPHGIALWYMDDGSAAVNRNKHGWISSCYTNLYTYCSEEEALDICAYFKEKHDIEFRIGHEKSGCLLRANTEASRRLAKLVYPYIIPSMMYKLAHVANLNLHEPRTSGSGPKAA